MKFIAVMILLVFYGCYFLKALLQKQKGIRTNQMGKGKQGLPKIIELVLTVTTYTVVAVEAISIFFIPNISPLWLQCIGLVFSIIGIVVFICSVITMRDSWRAGVSSNEKTELVTGGIYSLSRNPAFLGFDLVYLGLLCMYFNWLLLPFSIWAIVAFHVQVVYVEEKFLQAAFGAEYMNYKKEVNRYFGKKLK